MDNIKDFPLDNWIREFNPKCKVALHASCAKTLSVAELQQLSAKPGTNAFDTDLKLDYGPFEGSAKLRTRIAELHSTAETQLTADNVIITPGSILANYLVLQTLCKKGDHVICQYPAYGQLYLCPDIMAYIPNTRAIILNNPNNPIGAILPKKFLENVIEVAKKSNISVFCDEVFTPLFHTDDPTPPPLVSLGYENSVSTGSLSKAYGLPGVRVGWVISKNAGLLRKILIARDYTTISVSQLDDSVAAFALSSDVRPNLLKRNLALCRESIAVLDDFVKRNKRCQWTKPRGGGTGFIQILDENGQPVDDYELGVQVEKEQNLLVVPCGFCFRDEGTSDFKGYLRFPLGDPDILREGLPLLQKFLNG